MHEHGIKSNEGCIQEENVMVEKKKFISISFVIYSIPYLLLMLTISILFE